MMSSTIAPVRILLITSSSDDEQMIRIQLKKDGLSTEIQQVDDETEFTAALDLTIDLVLFADPQHPFQSTRAIRILRERKLHIPFILISDMDEEDLAKAMANQGVDDYLTKANLTRLGFIVQRSLEIKRLREKEERYRGIFENATVAIWDEDFSRLKVEMDKLRAHGMNDFRDFIKEHPEFVARAVKLVDILDANEPALRLFKVKDKAEVLGSLDKFVPPQIFQEELIAFAEGNAYFEREIRSQTPQGKLLDLLMTITYYTDPVGRSKALVHVSDITERKQAERAMRESETRYRTLVEQIPPIIYISDPDQSIGVRYISPGIEALGFGPEEWIADPQLWFRQVHPQDQGRVLAEIEQNGESGKLQAEYRLISKDGKIRWFLDEAINILDKDGKVLFRQGFMLDITERKQAEESLAARERYLELLNGLTRKILLATDWDTALQSLAFDIRDLVEVDDCYIVSWDEERQVPIPVATTAKLDFPLSEARVAREGEIGLVPSVLQTGHALIVEDSLNSPYIDRSIAKEYPSRSGIAIPLIARGDKLGAAVIAYNTSHAFTPEEVERAEHAGHHIALALWTFRQSIEIQQRLKESNTLAKIERALSETERIGTGNVLQLIVDSVRELMPQAQKSVIHLLESDEQLLVAQAISSADENKDEIKAIKMKAGEGVAGYVILEGETIIIKDIKTNPKFMLSESEPTFQSLMVAPVQLGGQPIGTISVQSSAKNAFSAKDASLLNALAVQSAIAIENSRLLETTQQKLKEVNILYKISRSLAASLDADQLIRDTIRLLQQNFDYYSVQICLIDPETRNLVIRHGSGYRGDELVQQQYQILAGEGIVGHVAETGKPFMTNNVEEVAFFKDNPLLPHTKFEMAIPINVNDRITGVLDIQQTGEHDKFTSSDLDLMIAIADHLAVVLQKAKLYQNLQTALEQEKKVRSELLQSERLALVGRLLASVSHELNNPLQAIQYGLFLIKNETNLVPQVKQDIDVLIAETERMTALIERLRSTYRPVRLKDFQSIPLNHLVEDVYALISTYMRHNEVAFEFIPEMALPNVSGLPDQLRQVMLNLFLNAIDVMEPGGRLTIETHSLSSQKEVMLIVKDTGPGIDPEILPRIFDAFITNKQTGTGLGLTITHDIIQQHHGRIAAENNPEGGAIFKVWLPTEEGGTK